MGNLLEALLKHIAKKIEESRGFMTYLVVILLLILLTDHFYPLDRYLKLVAQVTFFPNIIKCLEASTYCMFMALILLNLILWPSMMAVAITEKITGAKSTKIHEISHDAFFACLGNASIVFEWFVIISILLYFYDQSFITKFYSHNVISENKMPSTFYMIYLPAFLSMLSLLEDIYFRFLTVPHLFKPKQEVNVTISNPVPIVVKSKEA